MYFKLTVAFDVKTFIGFMDALGMVCQQNFSLERSSALLALIKFKMSPQMFSN